MPISAHPVDAERPRSTSRDGAPGVAPVAMTLDSPWSLELGAAGRSGVEFLFSVSVALTNIPEGELLTGFAMRSDPNVVFG